MKKNILITGVPAAEGTPPIRVNKTIQPTERDEANVEAERGEILITDSLFTGFPELFVIGGKNHSEGGTPLNVTDNSFVFSKDKTLKIKNDDIQKVFGKKEKKTGYTPAELAKQYEINKYRKILADPDSDNMERETAELMIKNYNEKLGQLALVQESMKAFPQGIPFISIPYLEMMGIDPAQFVTNASDEESESPLTSEEDIPVGTAKKGGQMNVKVLSIPKAQKGLEMTPRKRSLGNPQLDAMYDALKTGTDPSVVESFFNKASLVSNVDKEYLDELSGKYHRVTKPMGNYQTKITKEFEDKKNLLLSSIVRDKQNAINSGADVDTIKKIEQRAQNVYGLSMDDYNKAGKDFQKLVAYKAAPNYSQSKLKQKRVFKGESDATNVESEVGKHYLSVYNEREEINKNPQNYTSEQIEQVNNRFNKASNALALAEKLKEKRLSGSFVPNAYKNLLGKTSSEIGPGEQFDPYKLLRDIHASNISGKQVVSPPTVQNTQSSTNDVSSIFTTGQPDTIPTNTVEDSVNTVDNTQYIPTKGGKWFGKVPGVDYAIAGKDTLPIFKKLGGALDKLQKGGFKSLGNGRFQQIDDSGTVIGEGTLDSSGRFVLDQSTTTTVGNTGITKATGSKQSDLIATYKPGYIEDLQKAEAYGIEVDLPQTFTNPDQRVRRERIQKQRTQDKSIYGSQDWTDAYWYPDFKRRAAWYLSDHQEFNPKDKEQVKKFQIAYNERANSLGLSNVKVDVDGKFGKETYSIAGLNPASKKNKVVPTTTKNTPSVGGPELVKPEINYENKPQTADFWTQDVVNMLGAVGDKARLRKFMPWQAGYSTLLPEGTYFDPTRELAANAEQANIAENALGMFAGPQALSARMSDVQGSALANAANILGKYNTMNVDEANKLELNRVQIMNQDSANRANQATDLYNKTVMTNENFNNAKTAARKNIRDSFIAAWTNRGKTQALNAMNKQYKVDPLTGFVEFTGVPGTLTPEQKKESATSYYNTLMENPNLRSNPEHASILLKSFMKGLDGEDNSQIPYSKYK